MWDFCMIFAKNAVSEQMLLIGVRQYPKHMLDISEVTPDQRDDDRYFRAFVRYYAPKSNHILY